MLKELTTKTLFAIFLFSQIFQASYALEISAFKQEEDNEATITFCKTLEIKNVSLNRDSVVQTVIFEKDDGEFENVSLLNDQIANKIIACFEGVCDVNITCKSVPYTLISARKVKDQNLVVAKVAFDEDINAVFLVSTYQKKNKTMYRVKTPQDLKFLSGKYKKNFRNWLINKTKDLL